MLLDTTNRIDCAMREPIRLVNFKFGQNIESITLKKDNRRTGSLIEQPVHCLQELLFLPLALFPPMSCLCKS
jgi:hypothetical protein